MEAHYSVTHTQPKAHTRTCSVTLKASRFSTGKISRPCCCCCSWSKATSELITYVRYVHAWQRGGGGSSYCILQKASAGRRGIEERGRREGGGGEKGEGRERLGAGSFYVHNETLYKQFTLQVRHVTILPILGSLRRIKAFCFFLRLCLYRVAKVPLTPPTHPPVLRQGRLSYFQVRRLLCYFHTNDDFFHYCTYFTPNAVLFPRLFPRL